MGGSLERIPKLGSSPRKTLKDYGDLKRMQISTLLETEILSSLVGKERMVSELTEEIYGVTRQSPSYHTYYMKVSRAVRALQRNGYVTTKVWGRDKPFKLTAFAASKIMDVDGKVQRVVPLCDALVYVAAVGFGLANIFLAASAASPWLSTPKTILPYTAFLVLSGYSLARLSIAVRKVS